MRAALAACTLLLSACTRPAFAPLAPTAFPFAVDSVRTVVLMPGAAHRTIWSPAGPWVVHVLDVRLDRCFTAVAVKGAPGAVGRRTTSDLMRELAARREVIGGVNADFFLFAPPGVPTNAHVSAGRVITPPTSKPAFAMDSAGVPRIATFTLPGLDSLVVDDPRLARASLRPFHPLEAVGGRPVLTRDSVIVPDVDTEGQASFSQARHPRTAVGIADGGRRLVLLVVDGRQPGYSAGMTLREMGTLMLALGAPESLNLDGGGSTALVLARPDSARAFRAVNKPSDPTGERAVGNALAVVKGCRGR
jgi:exopolysaccharide biosynthesis protein